MPRRPLILFFNPFLGQWPDTGGLNCQDECEFTTDSGRLPQADGVIFHLPTLPRDTATPKFPGQQWVAWCLESAVTCPAMADPAVLQHFDVTMTYRRDADIWSPYLHAGDAAALLEPPPVKTESAPVVHFQSHRYDRSGRTRYAAELMKRVKVDSYGKILHNKPLAAADAGADTARRVMERYKFALAFENTVAPDYVTDKFFNPLRAGTVPVYLGAPNVDELAPGERCFIDVADFAVPAELAAHLNHLDANEWAYRKYFAWKAAPLRERFRRDLESVRRHSFCRLCDLIGQRRRTDTAGEPRLLRIAGARTGVTG